MVEIDPTKDMFDKTKVPVWEYGQLGGRTRPIDQDILFRNLCDVVDVFDKHNIKYAISHGTILGLLRYADGGGLIPWDDDIDLTLFTEDMPKMSAAESELRSKGYHIPIRTENPEDKVNPFEKGFWYDFNAIKDGEKVEGWFTDKTDTKYVYDVYREGLAWDRKFLDTLSNVVWRGRTFNCPNHTQEYLSLMYGDDPILPITKDRKYRPLR